MATIEHAIGSKSTFELEHRVIRADGTLGWTFSRAIPLMDDRGAIVEWFGTAKDVTDRKRDGATALRLAPEFRPHIAVVDIGLPATGTATTASDPTKPVMTSIW